MGHPYFRDPKSKKSVFDEVMSFPLVPETKGTLVPSNRRDLSADSMAAGINLAPRHPDATVEHMPVCHAVAKPTNPDEPEFDDFAWINPSGLWRDSDDC